MTLFQTNLSKFFRDRRGEELITEPCATNNTEHNELGRVEVERRVPKKYRWFATALRLCANHDRNPLNEEDSLSAIRKMAPPPELQRAHGYDGDYGPRHLPEGRQRDQGRGAGEVPLDRTCSDGPQRSGARQGEAQHL